MHYLQLTIEFLIREPASFVSGLFLLMLFTYPGDFQARSVVVNEVSIQSQSTPNHPGGTLTPGVGSHSSPLFMHESEPRIKVSLLTENPQ